MRRSYSGREGNPGHLALRRVGWDRVGASKRSGRARRADVLGRQVRGRRLAAEPLEDRCLLSVAPGYAGPDFVLVGSHLASTARWPSSAAPFLTGPTFPGYTPAQIRAAYGFDQITFTSGGTTIAGDGSGTTIAIVDAFDDPRLVSSGTSGFASSDLALFDKAYGLPDPVFTKVSQSGTTTYPTPDTGWAMEIALDVEWAHAIAPAAKILLVEAASNSYANLTAAVKYAASQPGVVAVSMSWGGGEAPSYDSAFLTPAGHAGVTFVASSGDSGAPAGYPATSPNVLAVGGTSLYLDSQNNYSQESGWSGSGGGISSVESKPSYQSGVTQSATMRTNPDVSYNADPNTGFPIYDSYGTSSAWIQIGGTSAGAPQWAALIAIADQGRALAGLPPLNGLTDTFPKLYSMPTSGPNAAFHDVVQGGSTGGPPYSAGTGYDLVTGLGAPYANVVVSDLVGAVGTPTSSATHFSITAVPPASTAGQSFAITISARDSANAVVTDYLGTVRLTSSDAIAGLPTDYTFTTTDSAPAGSTPDNGTHQFTVTLKTAGNQTVTVRDTANASIAGISPAVPVDPAAANQMLFVQQPSNVTVNKAISPAVTVKLLDPFGNLATSLADSGDQITISANGGGGTTSLTSVAATSGLATFSNLSISTAGSYTLTASFSSSTNSNPITAAKSNSFNVTASAPAPTADVAVTAITASRSSVSAGGSFSITVTVANRGSAPATFTLMLSGTSPAGVTGTIANVRISKLAAGASRRLSFNVRTARSSTRGTWVFTASANLPGDPTPADDSLSTPVAVANLKGAVTMPGTPAPVREAVSQSFLLPYAASSANASTSNIGSEDSETDTGADGQSATDAALGDLQFLSRLALIRHSRR
jgi:hypothetical protein